MTVIFFLFITQLYTSNTLAQEWSIPVSLPETPEIQFRQRAYKAEAGTSPFMIEWEFSNIGDSETTFSYTISSGVDDERVGRLTVKAQSRSIQGWFFTNNGALRVNVFEIRRNK